MSEDHDPKECVCCRALADGLFTFDGSDFQLPVCRECKDDGTFDAWVLVECRETLTEAGYTFETRDDGEYAIAPKPIL